MTVGADGSILHEQDVRAVIQDEIEDTVGATGVAITNASVAHALNATFSDTEVEGALDALGGKINSILAVLRTNGIIAS
jgi:uncharacterized membrane protein YqiK